MVSTMQKRISNLPFHDTPEQAKQLEEVIEKLKGQQGAVMPALHLSLIHI